MPDPILNQKRGDMIRLAAATILTVTMIWMTGCRSDGGSAEGHPRLMQSGNAMRGFVPARRAKRADTVSYPEDPVLKLKKLEAAHRERLAAIEAEKAKALKALELEKLRSVEEIRRRTREIESANALRLAEEKRKYASLLAEKEKTIKALETNASLHRDQTETVITRMETDSRRTVAEITGKYEQAVALLKTRLQEKKLWITVGVIILLLLAWFLFYRYRKMVELKSREEERRHEALMLERRLRHEEIEKVLEIIASEQTDESVKIELARLLRQGSIDTNDPRLLEYREKSGEENEKPAEK